MPDGWPNRACKSLFHSDFLHASYILSLNQDSIPAVSSSNLEMMNHFLVISDYFKVCKVNGEPIGFLIALLPKKDYPSEHYQWFNDKYDSFIYVDRIIFNKSYQKPRN